MVRSVQHDTVADLMERRADDARVIAHLTASEADLQQRVDALEDEVLDFMDAARALDAQVRELRAALADARRR
jgi:predicted  nucleic acid-binding Zn-ribbon protein